MNQKIGILYICTGKYSIFWKDFYVSMEKNFLTDSEKHYFVFTDNTEIDFENEDPNIHKIYQENLGWPFNTLMRFHIFLREEKKLSEMDYLFFFNANLIILKKINKEEFLPNKKEKLLATIHPGYYNKKRKLFTYETHKKSTAYIAKNQGQYYFAGGLNGGETEGFIEAMKAMRNNIDIDTKNNIIAKWHDESHWNKYLINKENVKILTPEYLYPEPNMGSCILPKSMIPKILIRHKSKYGGHVFLRNEKTNKLSIISRKIKNYLSKKIKPLV